MARNNSDESSLMMMLMVTVMRKASDQVVIHFWSRFEARTRSVRVRDDTHVPVHSDSFPEVTETET